MEVFRITKKTELFPAGTLGIFETSDKETVTLCVKKDSDGYWTKIDVPQEEVEETEYRVDSFTNEIISKGFYIRDEWYTTSEAICLELCQNAGYTDMSEAYQDGYFYWTEWEEGDFVFPNDLDVVGFEKIKG